MSLIVAIDGPAGSGKGTIAKLVAEKLNLIHIDTGAMYRSIALYTIKNNIKRDDTEKIIGALDDISINLIKKDGNQIVLLNNEDVTDMIRSEAVNKIVSDVSSIEKVREKLNTLQRNLANGKNVVMEGRDIGTVVFPNANVKIYLDGSVEERAKRRYEENIEKGMNVTFEEVKESIIARDKKDKTRKYGPLKMADDAIKIDTTNLSIHEVFNKVVEIINKVN